VRKAVSAAIKSWFIPTLTSKVTQVYLPSARCVVGVDKHNLLQPCNATAFFTLFLNRSFAKPAVVWWNTHNFLK
jgi:hypothetical protein